MLANKYQPNSQKALFHKNQVVRIKKWLDKIDKQDAKKVLLIYGPTGCGKSTIARIMLKAFNVFSVEGDTLRSCDKTSDTLTGIPNFQQTIFANNTQREKKGNIVLIDNVEQCEKTVETFVNDLGDARNTPIVLITNSQKITSNLKIKQDLTIVELGSPSLLELTNLTIDICDKEKIQLSREEAKLLVQLSQNDCRQVFFLLEQWKMEKVVNPKSSFSAFSQTVQVKQVDEDLETKLKYLMNKRFHYDFRTSYLTSVSEPTTLSYNLYTNYLQTDLDIEKCAEISDCFSLGQTMYNYMYDNQYFDIYDDYAITACVMPSFILKQFSNNEVAKCLPHKDFSHNFINSYGEIKSTCSSNMFNKWVNGNQYTNLDVLKDSSSCYLLSKMSWSCLTDIQNCFDQSKKGKNVSKTEKLQIAQKIASKLSVTKLIEIITSYRLYNVDYKAFVKKETSNSKFPLDYLETIDIKPFKRFLNIFRLNNDDTMRSSIDLIIQYFILEEFCKEHDIYKQRVKDNGSDSRTVNLDSIWNIK